MSLISGSDQPSGTKGCRTDPSWNALTAAPLAQALQKRKGLAGSPQSRPVYWLASAADEIVQHHVVAEFDPADLSWFSLPRQLQ